MPEWDSKSYLHGINAARVDDVPADGFAPHILGLDTDQRILPLTVLPATARRNTLYPDVAAYALRRKVSLDLGCVEPTLTDSAVTSPTSVGPRRRHSTGRLDLALRAAGGDISGDAL